MVQKNASVVPPGFFFVLALILPVWCHAVLSALDSNLQSHSIKECHRLGKFNLTQDTIKPMQANPSWIC